MALSTLWHLRIGHAARLGTGRCRTDRAAWQGSAGHVRPAVPRGRPWQPGPSVAGSGLRSVAVRRIPERPEAGTELLPAGPRTAGVQVRRLSLIHISEP